MYASKPLSYYSRRPRKPKHPAPIPRANFGVKNPYDNLSLIELQARFDGYQRTIEDLSLGVPQKWVFERIRYLQTQQDLIRKAKDWFNAVPTK